MVTGMTDPKKPLLSVNASVLESGDVFLQWAQTDLGILRERGYTEAEALDITRRGLLTAYANLSHEHGIPDPEIAASVEAFGGRIRSGEAAANAKAWLAEWEAAHEARKAAAPDGEGE